MQALGKIADLVPTTPFMAVGDTGEIDGRSFQVGGRLQLDHGRGPWDEWYVEFDRERWGWVAQAQGHVYLTFPLQNSGSLSWDDLQPDATFTLAAAPGVTFTVTERSGSALLSAEGELPFAAVPLSSGRYVDAEGPEDAFATIDFGDGSEAPQVFVGKRYPSTALKLIREAVGPRPIEAAEAKRLRCPTCGAPIDLNFPHETERAACGSCNSLLEYRSDELRFLKEQPAPQHPQHIPIGTRGALFGEDVLVIGFMVRYVEEDGTRYRWGEYLLHTAEGYRYLVESQGHFLYTRSVSVADVLRTGNHARYRGKRARLFQTGQAVVEYVVGEFYYKVMIRDKADTEDFVAPPYMLSRESTPAESNWSLGEYISSKDVFSGLGLRNPPQPLGVAPAQPNPFGIKAGFKVALSLVLLLVVTHLTLSGLQPKEKLVYSALSVPPTAGPPAAAAEYTTLSDEFSITGPTTLEITLDSNVDNNWLSVGCALVGSNGDVRQFFINAERWHGGYGEDAYNEGSAMVTTHIGSVPTGQYTMRFLPQWGVGPGSTGRPPRGTIEVRSGGRSSGLLWLCIFALVLPALWRMVRSISFESRRWRESNTQH